MMDWSLLAPLVVRRLRCMKVCIQPEVRQLAILFCLASKTAPAYYLLATSIYSSHSIVLIVATRLCLLVLLYLPWHLSLCTSAKSIN